MLSKFSKKEVYAEAICVEHSIPCHFLCSEMVCNRLICGICVGAEHRSHTFMHLTDVAETIKQKIAQDDIFQIGFNSTQLADKINNIIQEFTELTMFYKDIMSSIQIQIERKIEKIQEIQEFFESLLKDKIICGMKGAYKTAFIRELEKISNKREYKTIYEKQQEIERKRDKLYIVRQADTLKEDIELVKRKITEISDVLKYKLKDSGDLGKNIKQKELITTPRERENKNKNRENINSRYLYKFCGNKVHLIDPIGKTGYMMQVKSRLPIKSSCIQVNNSLYIIGGYGLPQIPPNHVRPSLTLISRKITPPDTPLFPEHPKTKFKLNNNAQSVKQLCKRISSPRRLGGQITPKPQKPSFQQPTPFARETESETLKLQKKISQTGLVLDNIDKSPIVQSKIQSTTLVLEINNKVPQHLYRLKDMLLARVKHLVLLREKYIYVVGGKSEGVRATDICEKYSILANRWELIPNLQICVKEATGLCVQERYLYVFSGHSQPSKTNSREIEMDSRGVELTPGLNSNNNTLGGGIEEYKEEMTMAMLSQGEYIQGSRINSILIHILDCCNEDKGWKLVNIAPQFTITDYILKGCGCLLISEDHILIFGGMNNNYNLDVDISKHFMTQNVSFYVKETVCQECQSVILGEKMDSYFVTQTGVVYKFDKAKKILSIVPIR